MSANYFLGLVKPEEKGDKNYLERKPNPFNKTALFAGPLSKTADIQSFRMAYQMDQQDVPKEEIWNKTGWFKGPDGMWRYEVDDAMVQGMFGTMPASAVIGSDLLKAYPELGKLLVESKEHGLLDLHEPAGFFDGANTIKAWTDNEAEAKNVLLHELQHAIQNMEGFSGGHTPQGYIPGQLIPQGQYEPYMRAKGEAEARAVQNRMNLSPEQRKAIPPWMSYDREWEVLR